VQGFATTRWSLILQARLGTEPAQQALAQICRDYRGPVLAFVRRSGYSAADAEDLTQEFFARFLEKRWHAHADPARGRFRSYLLTALRRFLLDAHAHADARKRGGGQHRVDFDDASRELSSPAAESPEQAFTRQWMATVIERALHRLRCEAIAGGKQDLFDRLIGFVAEPPDSHAYRTLADELGMRANTIAVSVHRLRHRLRDLVRTELLQTVADPSALDEELRELRGSLPDFA
jgi:RNA polymerase sigma-70 factor (ECF subfamily)